MKYCQYCGEALDDAARFCVKCGRKTVELANKAGVWQQEAEQVSAPPSALYNSGPDSVSRVFMIVCCVLLSLMIVPMSWCIPMTVILCKKLREHRVIGTGFKVCIMLFVSIVSGILLLCRDERLYHAERGSV